MANPVPLDTAFVIKVTDFFRYRQQGWSENYYINVAPGGTGTPISAAQLFHQRLITKRREFLADGAAMFASRFSDESVRGDSDLVFEPEIGLGGGNNIGPAAYAGVGWLFTSRDRSSVVRDVRIFRGWTITTAAYDPPPSPDGTTPNKVVVFFGAMEGLLNDKRLYGGALVQYVIRSFLRPGAPNPNPVVVTGFNVDGTGRLTFAAITADISAYFAGDIIRLSVPRRKCVKGVSGRHRIIAKSADIGGVTTFTLDHRFCCNPFDLVGTVGKMFREQVAYYPITASRGGRLATRKPGRPFAVSRGRQSGRCC